jgi:small subunit ribosomal protein S6
MIETYKSVIEQNGGKVEKTEMWGVKSLAYRIRKNRSASSRTARTRAPRRARS